MVLVFDLDDTLYNELAYVGSGFNAVSAYLSSRFKLNKDIVRKRMICLLMEQGRGKVFNSVLKEYNIFSEKEVSNCISVYRSHKPEIKLYPDAYSFIKKKQNLPIYIVTDGNKIVQRKKIEALGLLSIIKKAIPTRNYGIKYEKPSPYVFQKICEFEKCDSKKVIYFGDNPLKDFVGIKPLGFKSIRLLRGQFQNVSVKSTHAAHLNIPDFKSLTDSILYSLTKS